MLALLYRPREVFFCQTRASCQSRTACHSSILQSSVIYHTLICHPEWKATNQSINQSNFYSANSPGGPMLSGATAESLFLNKSKKLFPNINRPSGGKAKSERCVFRCFLKVATEMAERTDSGRLFQRDGAQEWKALEPVLVLILATDRLFSCLISVNGMGVMRQAWSEDKHVINKQ